MRPWSSLLSQLSRVPDGLGETFLTEEEAEQIRALGFPAAPGKWLAPVLPHDLVMGDGLLEPLSWTEDVDPRRLLPEQLEKTHAEIEGEDSVEPGDWIWSEEGQPMTQRIRQKIEEARAMNRLRELRGAGSKTCSKADYWTSLEFITRSCGGRQGMIDLSRCCDDHRIRNMVKAWDKLGLWQRRHTRISHLCRVFEIDESVLYRRRPSRKSLVGRES